MTQTALEKVVSLLGSQSAVARALEVTPQAVQHYIANDMQVPATWCLPLERATRGQVTRRELRPDLYPDDSNDSQQPGEVEAAQ